MRKGDEFDGRSEPWRRLLTPEIEAQVGALWGKSNASRSTAEPQPLLLLQHLFDSLAVGELLWDHYLAPCARHRLDEAMGGGGRRFVAWLCGLHDVGKATPAFQAQVDWLCARVVAAGLPVDMQLRSGRSNWKHAEAGACVVMDVLRSAWTDSGQKHHQWIWPLVAGHHGVVPDATRVSRVPDKPHGSRFSAWGALQAWLVEAVTVSAGFADVAAAAPVLRPSRADQLLLSGLMIMADWIASNDHHVGGIDRLDEVSMAEARTRAHKAWTELGLRGGWGELPEPPADVIPDRFGFSARPAQTAVVEAARALPAPGLLVVEAPTGEGKTEAALGAAEVLAARFGADGLFIGMPTQATSDPMFSRTRAWSQQVAPEVPLALLHGRSRFNPEWDRLRRTRPGTGSGSEAEAGGGTGSGDEFGMSDPYDADAFDSVDQDHDDDECGSAEGRAAAEWFLAAKRGLLAPVVIGTIDQLLFAATITKHVMLRYAGLAGKVVILDEVHAADTYMSQFLEHALAWLGEGQVPVVLLSATLAPGQRDKLVRSYLAGALAVPEKDLPDGTALVPAPGDYPSVTSAWAGDGEPQVRVDGAVSGQASRPVAVEVLPETEDDSLGPVVTAVHRDLADGGCALVIRNTVARAQETFTALSAAFPGEVVLLHSRLVAADRAERTDRLLEAMGKDGTGRPGRLIVVATQVAEQSFDVDADLLVTDLAPVDLLVQRAGRLHRHERPSKQRPARLRRPRMLVTGFGPGADGGVPWLPGGSVFVYGRSLMFGTAARVLEASAGDGWSLPTDVPALVADVYGPAPGVPASWVDATEAAFRKDEDDKAAQASKATKFVLKSATDTRVRKDLQGLNPIQTLDEEHVRVRDGDSGEEVLLVRQEGERLRAWGGTDLGRQGEAVPPGEPEAEVLNEILGGLVRLPARPPGLAQEVQDHLGPLPEWHDRPWLKNTRVVRLDDQDRNGDLPSFVLHYHPETGLSVERKL